MTVKVTRLEHSAEALRWFASTEADGKVVRRLLAIALVLEGCPRAEAAQNCGMDRQTLRDWIIATTSRVYRGCRISRMAAGLRPSSPTRRKRCWRSGSVAVPIRPNMGLCAGVCVI